MTTHRVLTVLGTRPEAIKLAPVIKEFERAGVVDGRTVTTGQHREMLDQMNRLFDVQPDHDLDLFAHGATLSQIFSRVIASFDPVLQAERPSAVIVQGDTTTSTAAAIAAFHRQIPVIHLEAGLRSGDMSSPFPEEGNRRLTSQIASLHLAPTASSKENLLREGVSDEAVIVTGNTVIDALHMALARPHAFADARLERVVASGRKILLVTTHRRENWGESMTSIGRALATIALALPHVEIVLPTHRNPVVRDALVPLLSGLANVTLVEPLGYGEFTRLLSAATLVLTDSGGVQEEAPSLGKPVLVMRTTTERPEAVLAGTARLVGTDEAAIVESVSHLLTERHAYDAMANAVNPYGDGRSAARVHQAVEWLLGLGPKPGDFVARNS